uniref:Protein-L-isoaspartate O-methyltransferase n=1 Tax=Corethrella appendiculata TaxID=1370023 RepID=U5EN57_9DIPT
MAWYSKGKNNEDLVNQLTEYGIIKDDNIAKCMKETDRKFYCASNHFPYVDTPLRIGYGATISAPHMHAYALELLNDHIKSDSNILDVGSGSGYLTSCFARLLKSKYGANATGNVIGIEHHPDLVELGKKNINADEPSLQESGKVLIVKGDGRLGYPEKAPYSAIHVGAAANETPQALIEQLKPGGRLICPVGPAYDTQYLEQYDKDESGKIEKKRLMGVMFVPLTDLENQTW